MHPFEFDHAILRQPGRSVVHGLRAEDGPSPTHDSIAAEHSAYVEALRDAGLAIDLLPPLEDYPDAIFVEDPALVFPSGAILLNPGAASRQGEADHLRAALHRHFEHVAPLDAGHADGGDVMVTPAAVLVGLSARTDAAGAAALGRALDTLGLTMRVVDPPQGALHLKTIASLIDEETVLTTRAGEDSGLFAEFRTLIVPDGEEAAANALRVNERLLVGAGFPRTIDLLAADGYSLVALETGAIGLLDAGLSCMSLRWKAAD